MFTRSDPTGSPGAACSRSDPPKDISAGRTPGVDPPWSESGSNAGLGWSKIKCVGMLKGLNVDVHICNKICEPFVRYDMCMLIMLYIARLYFIGISWDSKLPTQII